MFNNSSFTKLLAVFLAVGMIAGGAFAAAPTIDEETTNTTTESDVTDESTMATGFNANADNSTWVEASDMTEDGKLEMIDGDDQVVYTNSTPEATDEANGHYAFNITHDELSDIPVQSGAEETFEIRLYNDTSADDPDTTNITVTIEAIDGRTVVNVGESLAEDDDITTLATDGISALGFSVFADDYAELEGDDVAIDGANSTVTYAFTNSSTADRFSSAAEDADAGDLLITQQTFVDGEPVPVYYNEAGDNVEQGEDTYAVYDADGDDLTIYTGEDQDGEDSIDVHVLGNQPWSVMDLWSLADGVSEFSSFVSQKAMAGL